VTQLKPISVNTKEVIKPPTKTLFRLVCRFQKNHKGTKQNKEAQGGNGI
jgi:hypothetical protein